MQKGGIDITAVIFVVIVILAVYLSGGVNLSKAYEWAEPSPTPSPSPATIPSLSPSVTVTPSVSPSVIP